MARICIEYECEVQESQRRPTNLLDALERGDHHGGGDSDAVVGEEKVACSLRDTLGCHLCVRLNIYSGHFVMLFSGVYGSLPHYVNIRR